MSPKLREIEEPLVGDANLDGKVAFDDFLIVSKNFDRVEFLTNGWFGGDFGFNGIVSIDDFMGLSQNFGKTKEPGIATIPEPSIGTWFGLALLLFLLRRKPALFRSEAGADAG